MAETWDNRCPISKEKSPVERRAWRRGWEYRTERAPGLDEEKARSIARSMIEDPDLLSAWMQGYSAADRYLQDTPGQDAPE